MVESLMGIEGKHIVHAFVIGTVAGVVFHLLRVYALTPLESALGVPSTNAI